MENLEGRYCRVTEQLYSAQTVYGFKVGDYLLFNKDKSDGNMTHWTSEINRSFYWGRNCHTDGRLELMPIGFYPNQELTYEIY
jgi:hypothetical protein